MYFKLTMPKFLGKCPSFWMTNLRQYNHVDKHIDKAANNKG